MHLWRDDGHHEGDAGLLNRSEEMPSWASSDSVDIPPAIKTQWERRRPRRDRRGGQRLRRGLRSEHLPGSHLQRQRPEGGPASGGIKHLVMAGVATSGVILSTFTLAADEDYGITIPSDACADPKASLHEELMTNLFPRSATILTVDPWIASLTARG